MTDCIVAVVSDLHTNSTVGLCPPRFAHEGGTHQANAGQRWLWRNWLDYWQTMANMGQNTGLPIVAVINGDITDGDHHGTREIITRNEADQLSLAVEVLQPVMDVTERIIVIRGTAAHVGESAWMEEKIADDIGALPAPDGRASWWHLYASFGNVRFDIQHHPESGDMRPWTSGNGANRISSIVMADYVATDDKVPHVVVRSHKHVFATSGQHRRPFVVALPSWQLATAYVKTRVAAAGKINSVGGAYFVCRQGEYDNWDIIKYHPRRAKPYEVKWTE